MCSRIIITNRNMTEPCRDDLLEHFRSCAISLSEHSFVLRCVYGCNDDLLLAFEIYLGSMAETGFEVATCAHMSDSDG